MDLLSIILAIIGIGLLIFVHEGGHFLAARMAGVRVEVFSLGFGPRLWGFRWRDTDFRLSAVPFGGYVLVAGADPSDRRYPRHESLYAKSVAQRTLFWSGGVIMNLLFALLVFPVVFSAGVDFTAPIVGSVRAGSAAWEAELQPGDRVISVEGRQLHSLDNLAVEIALHGHRPVELVIERDDERRAMTVAPHFDSRSGLYQLGVDPSYGDFVLKVEDGSQAAAAGFATGDVVVAVNGEPATGERLAESRQRGEPVTLTVRRGDDTLSGTIPSRQLDERQPARIGLLALAREVLGVRMTPWLAELGIERGDVVLGVDGRPFLTGDLAAFASGPEVFRMTVLRAGRKVELEHRLTADQRRALAEHVALGQDDGLRVMPVEGRPAALAGMASGDLVEAVDGEAIHDWDQMRELVEASADQPLRVRVRRLPADSTTVFDPDISDLPRGDVVELVVTPRRDPRYDYGFKAETMALQQELRADGFVDALRLGTVCSLDLLKQSYVTLKRLITGDVGAKNLGGIIRITQVSYHAARRGPSWFWYFLALISVNLAFVNLLPIPVLDGGHLLFLLIEKVKGSPVSARVFGYSQVVGLVFVLLLVLFVTYNDILRLL